MKPSLQGGLTYEFKFRVPETKTVPQLFPEAPEFQHSHAAQCASLIDALPRLRLTRAVN